MWFFDVCSDFNIRKMLIRISKFELFLSFMRLVSERVCCVFNAFKFQNINYKGIFRILPGL